MQRRQSPVPAPPLHTASVLRMFHNPRRIWATLTVAALALGIAIVPGAAGLLLYRRVDLAAGQLWRLWSGHLVHFGWRHLLADLAVFAIAGAWIEQIAPYTTRVFLAVAPVLISALLYLADPQLAFYGGLSGLAVGLLVLLGLVQLRHDAAAPRWLWPAALAIVAGKVLLEAFTNTPLVSDFGPDIKVSTLAHLGGIACALLAWPVAGAESRRA